MLDQNDNLLSSYNYDLPNDFIAQSPIEPRHDAKLMIVNDGLDDALNLMHGKIWDLKNILRIGDLLVVNNTRVLKAKLKIRFSGGGQGELLLMEPRDNGQWLCLGRPARRMRSGDQLWLNTSLDNSLCLQVIDKDESTGGRIIQFPSEFSSRSQMADLLDLCGEVPLPPYIDKDKSNSHEEKYQTRFASKPGAIAAPTAGLHLSDELIEVLKLRGIKIAQITLHVGLGTFRPLEKEDLTQLHLHSEWVEVNEKAVKAIINCKEEGGKVFAVGTTSVRALEAAYLSGRGDLKPYEGKVNLVIKPGFKFCVIDGLLTNFHLPKSSLLLLVSALIGRKRMLELYNNAIANKYRFFSYGDAMLITPDSMI
ncbi:tRNA preQ1(34) S-adenosylmethionine ribosyltransferase-isomerase QueA [Prochlorococcus marinus]|uniref:S-adenosylmethionine:tRNA ribosyltransferase-isomerase n=1 Tax=Prochlorococcus marinus XMU1408 TaxID=2213228 RepID=A0A318R2S8_PROMR|nr:tRNA preQ1(34) S-adenosylmethionine ribosyltransferase-isomerase QueA [Prochlorococcus marinus]MBW3041422.1 tRNA preQ1(34) S-adenosylmethionine ribosyltransferase-isomerase QueA [Prochlorococcus marinus str. XMU1408]PYE02584.1 tRNA preQ1(34) S-adenosylmethionine ribosyltransferase-isomerase QueA [Prochlorococcus marinus XMU1408]